MLILPPGHGQALAAPRRLTHREKWLLRGVAATLAALALVLVVSLASAGPSSGHGCLHLTIPAATGAEDIDQCGAAARDTCATALAHGAFVGPAEREVVSNCRRAGLTVGG